MKKSKITIGLITLLILQVACAGVGGSAGGVGGFGLTSKNSDLDSLNDSTDATDDADFFDAATGADFGNSASSFGASVDESAKAGAGPQNQTHLSQNDPVDIPITIAKVEKPNVENITVTLETDKENEAESDDSANDNDSPPEKMVIVHKVLIKGLAGTVPNPQENTHVYFFDPATGNQIYTKVNADGSFDEVEIGIQKKSRMIVALSDQETIGEPVVLNLLNKEVYTWSNYISGQIFAIGTPSLQNLDKQKTFLFSNNSNQISAADKEKMKNSKSDSTMKMPNIDLGVDANKNKNDSSLKDQPSNSPRIIVREPDGSVRQVNDKRDFGNNVYFRHKNEIYKKNENNQVTSLYQGSRSEEVVRWDVLKKSSSGDMSRGDKSESRDYIDSDGTSRSGKNTVQFMGVITRNQLKIIDIDSKRILLQKDIEDVSDNTYLLIETEAPMQKIMSALIRER